jgi:hypothetical protein
MLRTATVAGVLLLLAAPLVGADPVADLYATASATVDTLDDAASSDAQLLTDAAAGSAGALTGPVSEAAAGLGGIVPGQALALHEWVGTGSADARFDLVGGTYACTGMQALIEHRAPLSNEPSFILSLAGGNGGPASLCQGGLRDVFKGDEWSGDAAHGWHARIVEGSDAHLIDVVVGPADAHGDRALSILWITNNGTDGVFTIAGHVHEVYAS